MADWTNCPHLTRRLPGGPPLHPLTEVSEILDISSDQAYALVRSGDLPAIKVGGRGQWRSRPSSWRPHPADTHARARWSSPSSGPDPNHLAHRRRTTLTASKGMITRPRDIFGPPSLGQVATGQLEGVGMDDVDRPGRPATSSVDHFHGSPVARELAQD